MWSVLIEPVAATCKPFGVAQVAVGLLVEHTASPTPLFCVYHWWPSVHQPSTISDHIFTTGFGHNIASLFAAVDELNPLSDKLQKENHVQAANFHQF